MSKQDLEKFIRKVDQLQKLVNSFQEFPIRKEELEACSSHEEVVNLAKSWGFDIGKRWGEL